MASDQKPGPQNPANHPVTLSPNQPSPTVAGALKNGQAQVKKAGK
jgi:hypothetical protein